MSRTGSRMRTIKKLVDKIDHSSKLRTDIPAGMAVASPPLGPMLGQRNINIGTFCKDFNERTAHIKEGIPIPCRVKVLSDRTYELVMHQPPTVYFLKQAAGVQRGKMPGVTLSIKVTLTKADGCGVYTLIDNEFNDNKFKDSFVGKITLKHLYEIAKIKATDPPQALMSLQKITQMLVGTARRVGIEIVRDLDPVEYAKFLEERAVIVEEQKRVLREAREAKMLRTTQ